MVLELLNAIIFASIITLIGFLVGKGMSYYRPGKPECRDWNKNHIMEMTLFGIGLLSYPFIPCGCGPF